MLRSLIISPLTITFLMPCATISIYMIVDSPGQNTYYDLVVIGGGAAGVFGAIQAAQIVKPSSHPPHILVAEKSAHLLSKVKISGGGRCNVTNGCSDPFELIRNYPHGGKELLGPFNRFQPRDSVQWFESKGVRLKEEPDGRIFPVTDKSQTIIDCLLNEADRLEIEICLHLGVNKITGPVHPSTDFIVQFANGLAVRARSVLLAPGGGSSSAYELARDLGHTIIPPVPSLFSFEIEDRRLVGLAGISVPDCRLYLPDFRTKGSRGNLPQFTSDGPLLITHKGLSGPAILRLSAWAARELSESNYNTNLQVNWLGDFTKNSFTDYLKRYRVNAPLGQTLKISPENKIPSRLWRSLLSAALSTLHANNPEGQEIVWRNASNQILDAIAGEVTGGTYRVDGKSTNKEEFVTSGGVKLDEVNFRTMESKLVPCLYFAGEYLDIDGLTGGFNFQAAWTTGWIAGSAIGQLLKPD